MEQLQHPSVRYDIRICDQISGAIVIRIQSFLTEWAPYFDGLIQTHLKCQLNQYPKVFALLRKLQTIYCML